MQSDFFQALKDFGTTTNEAAEAISRAMKKLPPPGDEEIILISMNPSLNFLQKRQLIKQIRRMQH